MRILLPDRPDHLLVWLSSYSYYEDTIPHGVRLFRYREGFMHQKVVLIDNELAIVGTANLGDGPILHMGPTYSHKLLDIIRKTARAKKIKTQIQPEARGTGTDAYAMQTTRGGVAAGLISVPSRYMHSPVETLSLNDAAACSTLIAETILGLTGRERFTR